MSEENVQYLIAKVEQLIAKQDTAMRASGVDDGGSGVINHKLDTGRSFEDLKFAYYPELGAVFS
jgi:hypothetical protein